MKDILKNPSCLMNHHDITDLVYHGVVKNAKTGISWERSITFLRNKKKFKLCFRWHILRRHRFVPEVTLNTTKPLFVGFVFFKQWILKTIQFLLYYFFIISHKECDIKKIKNKDQKRAQIIMINLTNFKTKTAKVFL